MKSNNRAIFFVTIAFILMSTAIAFKSIYPPSGSHFWSSESQSADHITSEDSSQRPHIYDLCYQCIVVGNDFNGVPLKEILISTSSEYQIFLEHYTGLDIDSLSTINIDFKEDSLLVYSDLILSNRSSSIGSFTSLSFSKDGQIDLNYTVSSVDAVIPNYINKIGFDKLLTLRVFFVRISKSHISEKSYDLYPLNSIVLGDGDIKSLYDSIEMIFSNYNETPVNVIYSEDHSNEIVRLQNNIAGKNIIPNDYAAVFVVTRNNNSGEDSFKAYWYYFSRIDNNWVNTSCTVLWD